MNSSTTWLTYTRLNAAVSDVSMYHLLFAFLVYWAARLGHFVWRTGQSPLRFLPGPRDRGHLLLGHLKEMMFAEDYSAQRAWRDEYGSTFTVRAFWGQRGLVTTDPRALTHVIFATHVYGKTAESQKRAMRLLGNGVLVAEGKEHRDQRRVINPAFGSSHVRKMAAVFLEKASEMCDIWATKCLQEGGTASINGIEWLSRATLDIIGKTGFGHDFNSLQTGGDELSRSFDALFRKDVTPMEQAHSFISNTFPIIARIAPGRLYNSVTESKRTMDKISKRIVQDKKTAVLADAGMDGRLDKASIVGTDLLSLLMRANLAEDLDPSLRMSDEAVIAQIPTFIAAGHETTSNATAWALLELSTHPEIQERLREELLSCHNDNPTIDEVNALPYLDSVARETLRLHAVVSFITRQALEDDIIPFSKPVTLENGDVVESMSIQKGDYVVVPISLLNTDPAIWGPNALEFDPSRWSSTCLPPSAQSIPGITPNLMTFMGGPRACIGHRFAVMEMKALLFNIVRRFEFGLGVERERMWTRSGPVVRPLVKGTDQAALPLVIKLVQE